MNFSSLVFFLIKDADLLKESILGGIVWNVPTEEGREGVNPFSLCKPYKHFRAFFFFGCLSLFSFLFLVSRSIIILFIFYSNHCEKGKSGPLTIMCWDVFLGSSFYLLVTLYVLTVTRFCSDSKKGRDKMALTYVISSLLLSVVVAKPLSDTPPQWSNAYTVSGVLRLPYAEIVEPMEVWFDGENGRSRIDYYSGETFRVRKRRQAIIFLSRIIYIKFSNWWECKVRPVCPQVKISFKYSSL